MRVTEDYVLLFGSSGECLYLEAFEKDNGDPAIRFNSAYIVPDGVGERVVAPD